MRTVEGSGPDSSWHGAETPRPRSSGDPVPGVGATVGEFWRWAHSDLLSNTERGVLAEFLVARAVGDRREVREPWADIDVLVPAAHGRREIRVEVKSAAFLQSWAQARPSAIRFARLTGRAWDPRTGSSARERTLRADVFVFALFTTREPDRADVLDLSQWEFHVLPASSVAAAGSRSLSLAGLRRRSKGPVPWSALGDAVVTAAREEAP